MKAILLHHAGGDKYAFKNVEHWLLPETESLAVELPGRSDRFSEQLLKDIHKITEDVFHQINKELEDDYCFVGVSMGTLIAYLLCHKIIENNLPLPKHLFLASRLSPDSYTNEPTIMNTSSEEFWNVVIQYDGVPKGLTEHKELREFYEPILRADFEALDKYNHSHIAKVKLNIPATILIGKNDTRNIELLSAQEWSNHFTNEVILKEFVGGHFFVYENEEASKYIKSTLLSY